MSFSPGVNLFVGENGAGKTNVLEALSFFKIGRSFRASRDTDLIHLEESFCRVEVHAEKRGEPDDRFSASIERGGEKRLQVNGNDVEKLSDLVGLYPCVLFGPHDLLLVSGPPEERRRFLDVTGSTTDRLYLEDLRAYRRVLGQRNALLRNARALSANARRGEKEAWDAELVRSGCALIEKRRVLMETLYAHILRHAETMGLPHYVEIRYDSDILRRLPEDVSMEQQYTEKLADAEGDEARRGVTLVGPHRDDVQILLDGKDVRRFGSQGQRRILAVLLRLTELSVADERTGERSVLLLDDVFSELDDEASARLRSILEDDHQVFVTSPVALAWGGERPQRTFHVEQGRIA